MTRTIITKEEFYKSLKDDNLRSNINLNFEICIDSSIVDWHYREIKSVVFEEIVVVKNVEINSGLSFVNCEFKKGIVFSNVQSTNYNSTYNSESSSISFSKCIASEILFSNQCFFSRNVVIKNDCKISLRVHLRDTKILSSGLSIKNSQINYLLIFNSDFDVNLFNSTFLKVFRIENLLGNVSLISNEFMDRVKLWDVECINHLTLNNNKFEKTFAIEACRINGLFIHGDTFDKKIELENRDLRSNNQAFLNEIYITEANFIEGFYCNGLGKSIKKITLPLTPTFQGLLKFEGWEVDTILISGVNQNLKLLFKRMFFRFFMINDFTNYSDISIDKCKGYGDCTLNLSDCDLGATKFNEFAFDSFKAIRIDNATLDRIKPTSNTWFNDEVLQIGNGAQTKQEEFKSKREIYRQIKQALKSNGNQIDSLIFQARELAAFRGEQKNSGNYDWADRVIMSVSQANDFGLNWSKPTKIVFGVTFFLYIALLPCLSDEILYEFAFCPEDLKNTWQAFSSKLDVFWQLFNPVRQMKATYGNVNSGWIYFIDLLHRIFLGIMIFQIVKAFRKFVSS